jgi:hypothetical protein
MAKQKVIDIEAMPAQNTAIPEPPLTQDEVNGMITLRLRKTGGQVKIHHTMLKHYPESEWEVVGQKKRVATLDTAKEEERKTIAEPVTNN